ncbi:MAG: RNA polymerase factor sigma-54 [Pseudomonadota bacterium]
MALAPKLEFKQSQQLVMTPQLQQAIKLLQLSNLELSDFIEQQLEENPFLERAAEQDGAPAERRGETEERRTQNNDASSDANNDATANAAADDTAGGEALDLTKSEAIAEAQDAFDTAYDDGDYRDRNAAATESDAAAGDYKTNDWAGLGNRQNGFDDDREAADTHTSDISLRDHLTDQLKVASADSQTLFVGAYIIDLIDDAGYLRETTDAISERLGADESAVVETLNLIQAFDPSGVGARDLKECMRLQLRENDRLDPAMDAFIEHLELLAKADLKGLMKATKADEDDVRDMIAEVRALNPKPGYAYGADHVQVIAPDVFIRKAADGGWKIELNNDTLPKVLVNQHYYAEISKNKGKEKDQDAAYVQEQFANASWLAKSLDQRARTILKVAGEIVRQQDAFLAYGIKHLRPLNLKAVAEAIEMHESTVSRVTANKYVSTPRGLFELKYFFTASIASSEGGEAHSAESVRHRIRELIDEEKPDAILSDDKIVEILKAEGVDIARRTVAKYRETLGLASSVQRRRAALRKAI